MRRFAFWVLLAVPLLAQWRHFGAKSNDLLSAQNAVREKVGVPPLVWSSHLAKVAQSWADSLLAHHQFTHSHGQYGENLFEIRGAAASPSQVIDAWAGESRQYDHASNHCSGVCGHYTQIIWSGTKETGCAVARGGDREVWVCEYDPPGNWVGQRPY